MLVDIIVIILIIFFTITGLQAGFIKTFGGFLGSIIGFIGGATITYWLMNNTVFFSNDIVAIISFIVISYIIIKLVELLFTILDSAYKFLSIIPFLKPANKFLGGVFGLIESLIALGALAVFVARFFPESGMNLVIQASTVLPKIAQPINIIVEAIYS